VNAVIGVLVCSSAQIWLASGPYIFRQVELALYLAS